jgi:pyruvate dehydrogenase E2 component (dihydrolipoamide acetyltransferase)
VTAAELIDVKVPDIGDFADVPVIEIHVAVGDTIAVEDPLVTLESDKATMDVPAAAAGVVKELRVKVGDTVSEGTVLLALAPSVDGQAAASATEVAVPDAAAAPVPTPTHDAGSPPADSPETVAGATVAGNGGPVYASPSVRRIARELGVELARVTGTGRKGRITTADVEAFVAGGTGTAASDARVSAGAAVPGLDLAPWPAVNYEKFGPVERVARTRIQKIAAPNLARNWVMIPHVTNNDEADITDLEAFRKQMNEEHARQGVKLTMVGFLIVASVATLKQFPAFNSSLEGDELVLKRYYNIGFAADTPDGLVVPVIKNADAKGILEIARELAELSGKAREGKLGPTDIQGSTFTISSLGGIGGTSFTPIVNAPEVAILGASRSAMRPVWNGTEFAPRLMLPLSLSYDHRVIDGAAAARFLAHLTKMLFDLRRALL